MFANVNQAIVARGALHPMAAAPQEECICDFLELFSTSCPGEASHTQGCWGVFAETRGAVDFCEALGTVVCCEAQPVPRTPPSLPQAAEPQPAENSSVKRKRRKKNDPVAPADRAMQLNLQAANMRAKKAALRGHRLETHQADVVTQVANTALAGCTTSNVHVTRDKNNKLMLGGRHGARFRCQNQVSSHP